MCISVFVEVISGTMLGNKRNPLHFAFFMNSTTHYFHSAWSPKMYRRPSGELHLPNSLKTSNKAQIHAQVYAVNIHAYELNPLHSHQIPQHTQGRKQERERKKHMNLITIVIRGGRKEIKIQYQLRDTPRSARKNHSKNPVPVCTSPDALALPDLKLREVT